MAPPTDQQVAELNALNAAYNAARTDEKAKTATAAQKQAEADAAAVASADAATAARVAQEAEDAALKKLADFTLRLIDPVVGIDVHVNPPTER